MGVWKIVAGILIAFFIIVVIIGIFAYIGAKELDKTIKEQKAKDLSPDPVTKKIPVPNLKYRCHYDDSGKQVCVRLD